MKNIHVLPTDKPSRLLQSLKVIELLDKEWLSPIGNVNRNICITSNESLKQGEENLGCYYLHYNGKIIKKNNSEWTNTYNNQFIKKIILTDNKDLIKDGVQAIDDEFLEWFVKNSSCESVEVQTKITKDGVWTDLKGYVELPTIHSIKYKIIIPKEEICSFCDGTGQVVSSTTISRFKTCDCKMIPQQPKQETLEEVECNNCGYLMSLTEDESVYACYNSECTSCYEEYEEEPKQETMEYGLLQHIKFCLECKNESQAIRLIEKYGFEKQEKGYSEEDMVNFALEMKNEAITGLYGEQRWDMLKRLRKIKDRWFEQFKNK
jgi:hypothetical protein